MADPITYEQMRDLLRDHASALRSANVGGGGGGSAPSSGGGGGSVLPSNSAVQGFGVSLIDAFNKLSKGSITAADGLNLVTGALSKIPGAGKIAAAGIGALGGQAIEGQQAIKRGSDTGITMSGDIGAMKELSARSRMTMDEFIQKMGTLGPKMNGLGSTMDEAAKNTGKISEEFIQSPMGRQLQQMGMNTDELNNITMQYLANRKFSDLSDAKQRKQVNEELQLFAQNLAENSRVTGISTQQQSKNVEGAVANGMVQAKILQMGPEGESAYRKMRGSLEGMGDDVQKFADEIFTGGIRTKEGTERMAALGPAGRELEAAVMMSKNAKTAEQRAAADAAMASAQQRVSEHMRSKQFTDMVLYQQNSLGQMGQRMLEQNKRVGAQMAGERQAVSQGLAPSQGAAVQRQQAAAQAQGRDPRTGAALPGAQTFQTLQAAENRAKDEAAGLGTQFNKLNKEIGNTLEKWGVLNSEVLKPKTTEGASISSGINKVLDKNKGPRQTTGEMLSRQEGSLGTVGKLIEDFGKGTPAMLHGKEGVITEKQLNDLLQTATNIASSTIKPVPALTLPKVPAETTKVEPPKEQPVPKVTAKVEIPKEPITPPVTPKVEIPKPPVAEPKPLIPAISELFPKNLFGDIQSKISGMAREIQNKTDSSSKKVEAPKPAPTPTPLETPKATSAGLFDTTATNEIKDLLTQLNITMKEMLAKSTDMVDMSNQQVRATKKLSGNRFG